LQLIAESKRDFHKNHYVLSKIVIEKFQIETELIHPISKNYSEKIRNCEIDFKILNEKILTIGFILDGFISRREIKKIKKLHTQEILRLKHEDIKKIAKMFLYGKGVDIK
jgi:hypothetical protein